MSSGGEQPAGSEGIIAPGVVHTPEQQQQQQPLQQGGGYPPIDPHMPQPMQAVQYVPINAAIPGDKFPGLVKGSVRMLLMSKYLAATKYQPNAAEQSLLSSVTFSHYLNLVNSFMLPIFIWIKSGPRLTPEEIELKAAGNESQALRLTRLTQANWGWSKQVRVLAVLSAFISSKLFSFYTDGVLFDSFTKLEAPLGEYARYLVSEGQRASAAGLLQIAHPPIPMGPVYAQPPPQYEYAPPQQPSSM
eukprot:Rhum_TRINITY_DN4330_c0_g1::Rhum_TRINITY_DN4330_c0_g1_i1::g.13929::m.13929